MVVLTDQSLKAILHQPDTSNRMAKWVIKLNEFDIQYYLRPSMKAQVLADFVVECTVSDDKSDHKSDDKLEQVENSEVEPEFVWVLHIDGASNAQRSRVGLILINSEEIVTE